MKHSTIALVLALILAVGVSFLLGGLVGRRLAKTPQIRPDTVIVEHWERDTIYEPKDSFIVKWKIAYLPVHDTTEVHDTTHHTDSVLVEVPITEKTYAGQYYHATIRGYQPELVEMWIKEKEKIVTLPYRKHWGFSVGPQLGYGFTPKGWQPYAGAGVTIGYSF